MRFPQGEYLTVTEAAEKLRVSVSTIRRWIRDGTLQAHRTGRRLLLRRDDVTASLRAVSPASDNTPSQRNGAATAQRPDHAQSRRLPDTEREQGLRTWERLKERTATDSARREASGIVAPASWEVIREAPEMRAEQVREEDDAEFNQFDIGVLADMIVHSPDLPRRRRLATDEQRRMVAALERADRTRERIRRRSGVETFPPSEDIIAEMREERIRQLLGEDDSAGESPT